MTVKEEISKFTHEVEEVLHEVEEVLNDVKEHMILSVRDYSIQIAFVLMGITSAILFIGTVYVWCFHHPKRPHSADADHEEHPSSKKSNVLNRQHSENSDSIKSQRKKEKGADETQQEVFDTVDKTEVILDKTEEILDRTEEILDKTEETIDNTGEHARKSEQNGQVRKRTTSSNVNNNNSPVKSKIPVRQKSRTSSS